MTREEVERLSIALERVNATARATYPYQGYSFMDDAARLLRALLDAKEKAEAERDDYLNQWADTLSERDALRKELTALRLTFGDCKKALAKAETELNEAHEQSELCCAGQDDLRKELEEMTAKANDLKSRLDFVLAGKNKAADKVDTLRKERDEARDQTRVGLSVGHGLMVYGTMQAIMRAQTFVLLDSKHPQEVKDTNHLLAQDLQSAEAKLAAAIDRVKALEVALLRLANAADDVGVKHFDTDSFSLEVDAMMGATQEARAALVGEKTDER